ESRAYELGKERHSGTWLDYVMGCTGAMREAGYLLAGCDLHLSSDVPLGGGLSSSAALEVALLRALCIASELELDGIALALLGQRAENKWVGAPVGAMDQIAASVGVPGQALFIDMRSLETQIVGLPPELEVIVIASGITHSNASAGYRTRRAECVRAAHALKIAWLRDATLADVASLPAPLDRRVRHVVTENLRVLETVTALASSDLEALGALFAASHRSMRTDYEMSVPEIDLLVELSVADRDVIAARLTGGGFGGSIVVLARVGQGMAAARRICIAYRARTKQVPTILSTSIAS
ncbi:MAG TPA: hypothetical protein VGC41_24885, partial [Kofleriaceae bacterium]